MGINSAMYNGVSGLNSFSAAISVVGDNVANSNTTAYKTNKVHFGDMVNQYLSINSNDTESEGAGSMILGISTDYAQGLILNTSNWADLAIGGEGFFNVQDPISGKMYYTRDGSFHLDDQAYLVNMLGHRVQAIGGSGDIQVPNIQNFVSFHVETDGSIYGVDNTGAQQFINQVALFSFSNKDGLVRQGNNVYIAGPEVGQVFDNATLPEIFGKVLDYSLENSNVDLAKQMVDMIIFQASYNANSKTITTCKDMIDATINMVR
ncbi:MAG: flagellar hook basal-body protein [Syntrophobacteraceae bacterium]|jgi:flagellar hook protein FlgE|nr:flagellar hook basal-body protein [Syntrophobacteraceae bacterium]